MSLGRGLGALITPTTASRKAIATDQKLDSQRIWHIPVSEVHPNPKQPRRYFEQDAMDELADSIRKHGVLEPLLVSEQVGGGYELIAGERRWRACRQVGLPTVPVIVKELADQEKLEISLIENIQRADLNPIEEAFAYKRLIEEFHLTQQEVGEKVGKARPTVANMIRLLDLPEEAQTALILQKINTGQARALLSLEGEAQLNMLSSMLGQKITVRELEREVSKQRLDKSSLRRDPNLSYLEDKLREALGTKVAISQRGEKGTVTISYFSKEELARVIKKIEG